MYIWANAVPALAGKRSVDTKGASRSPARGLQRRGRGLLIVFLYSIVQVERMMLVWVIRLIVLITVVTMLREAAAAGLLFWIKLEPETAIVTEHHFSTKLR